MTDEELRTIALKVVSQNQDHFGIDDTEKQKMYRLAYNDGVLDLLDAILEKKNETIKEMKGETL